MTILPMNDWVLVKMDPFPEQKGGLFLPQDCSANAVRTGTVVSVGRGKKVGANLVPVGVEPGEKVAFLRWHLEHKNGKQLTSALADLGDSFGMIRSADILFAFDANTNLEIGL